MYDLSTMSSIDLYNKTPDSYDRLQHKRPDYVGAQQAFVGFAAAYFGNKKAVSIVDFCSGTGKDTRLVSERVDVAAARLIDINEDFLKQALEQGIKAKDVGIVRSDILTADVGSGADVVISMFAYHHVKDADKSAYVKKAKAALKPGGIVLLGEIYSPDKQMTLAYYEHLIRSIPGADKDVALQTFLRQTAASDDFEYKVSRQFAHGQFTAAGFELLDSKKIWPTDDAFPADVGTFVEVWGVID